MGAGQRGEDCPARDVDRVSLLPAGTPPTGELIRVRREVQVVGQAIVDVEGLPAPNGGATRQRLVIAESFCSMQLGEREQ